MLKSYKDVRRWYPPLDPEQVAATATARALDGDTGVGDTAVGDTGAGETGFTEDGMSRYPHYIRETAPEPFDPAFVDEPATRRAEFTGGWSDWVAGQHAPGPDDDYPVRHTALARLPWDETDPATGGDGDSDGPAVAAGRRTRAGRDPGAIPLRRQRGRSALRAVLILAIAVLLLAVGAAVAVVLLHGRDTRQSLPLVPAPMRLTSVIGAVRAAGAGPADCPTERLGRVVRGAEPGGTDSGPDAILWFQHAYYVERSAEQTAAVLAPDAKVPPAEVIQRGIDSVPLGTGYCVRVVTERENVYTVEITERRPGGQPATYDRQRVTTAVVDGRTLITSIAAG